jgi:hypothetical protein
VLPGQSPDGQYILSVLIKRTFDIVPGQECVRALEDSPFNSGDEFWDHPMNSSVRYESDFIPFKPGTDVVLNGVARAPGGRPVTSCSVALQIGSKRKELTIFGDRIARYADGRPPVFTDPEPFTTMPVQYERAYGGIDIYSDPRVAYPYPRNPLGRGFVVHNAAKALHELRLPNIELPDALLTPETLCVEEYAQWMSRPAPAGFGWFPKTWMPRASLAGVLPCDRPAEQELRRAFAELLKGDDKEAYLKHGFRDMDFRFFNGASPGCAFRHLQLGETIAIENLTAEGRLEFRLPSTAPKVGIDIGTGVQEPAVALHTVMIRSEERQVDLVWRGAVTYPGPDWLPEMQKLDVLVS